MTICTDADSLDMIGEWLFVQSYAPWVPPVPGGRATDSFEVKFDPDPTPGTHGGVKFKGYFTGPRPQEGTFHGETFYNRRGVQLVQMFMELESHCYYQLLSGKHLFDESPEVVVDGAYVDVGGSLHPDGTGSGYFGLFQMRKR